MRPVATYFGNWGPGATALYGAQLTSVTHNPAQSRFSRPPLSLSLAEFRPTVARQWGGEGDTAGGAWEAPAASPSVRADTLSKPDFQRIKELKALINGIFMKEGEMNISGLAGKCRNNWTDDSQRSHGSHAAERLFEGVIGWNPRRRKYRELVNCLDSSFFSSKWKRTHLSSLTLRCLSSPAQVKVKCLSGQSCEQLPLPASCPYQVDIIDKIEEFSNFEKNL